jgi:hypothetical protein
MAPPLPKGVGVMDDETKAVIDQVANALAAAVLLAAHVRRTTGAQVLDAEKLEQAVNRAARAISTLKPENGR